MINPDVADFIKALARANAKRDIEIGDQSEGEKLCYPTIANARHCGGSA